MSKSGFGNISVIRVPKDDSTPKPVILCRRFLLVGPSSQHCEQTLPASFLLLRPYAGDVHMDQHG